MKIHIELKKKRYILYAAIIALLGVVGANISILHTNADKITKHNRVQVIPDTAYCSIQSQYYK